jgi:hypothetical protein
VSQVSAPIRAVALIGMLAALAVGAWSFMGGHGAATSAGSASADSSVAAVAKNPVAAAQAVAGKLNAHNSATAAGNVAGAEAATATKPKPAAKAAAPSTPAAKPATAKAKPKPSKAAPATTKDGTPTTIASLLRDHRSVVVLLYDPQSSVDAYSVAEAQLGASRANAGFIRVDVLDQHQAAPFTKAYGVLQDPTILFFARPGKLVQKLTGFADHDTVAQAALNAALGLGSSQTTTTATP